MFAASEQAVSNPSLQWFSALFAVGLTIIHLYSGKLRFLDEIPRRRWLLMASQVVYRWLMYLSTYSQI